MATAPADQRPVFIAAALFVVALTILATRYVNSAAAIEAKPLPAADLQAASLFLTPLSDTSMTTPVVAHAVAQSRDPFATVRTMAGQGLPDASARPSTSLPPRPASSQPWVVSTILLEGSRKSAIVNNVWVAVGDSLGGGSRLTEVERDHVIVTDAKGVRHKVSIQGGEL
jgi:hypothetical protein